MSCVLKARGTVEVWLHAHKLLVLALDDGDWSVGEYCPLYPLKLKTKLNSVALVRERTIRTERPPPVGEVSANFCG